MRKKLARDLYLQFASKGSAPSFAKVGQAEQLHFDLVGILISRYELEDPAFGRLPGSFSNPVLQGLYDELLAMGAISEADALAAAAFVEETDLADVTTLEEISDDADLMTVEQNLARGSRNHLRGFVAALATRGVTYEPQVLNAEEYAAIVSSEVERGAVDEDGDPLPGTGACNAPSN